MDQEFMQYLLYRDQRSTNEQILHGIVEETKNYVFDDVGIVLSSEGYSGVPLRGQCPFSNRREDLWKIIDILFHLTTKFNGLIFTISTNTAEANLFHRECERNEVLPKWCSNFHDFNGKVYGFNGVLHMVSPDVKKKFPGVLDVEIIRRSPRETRNILITEAVKQRILLSSTRNFGMQRISVNVPEELAYIAKQRPDLLSLAIREHFVRNDHSVFEQRLEKLECVMVHAHLNSRDWKAVTAVADIESPGDIVSHRVSLALLEFDEKYTSLQNGLLTEQTDNLGFLSEDRFERERFFALLSSIKGSAPTVAHKYQMAKSLISSKHRAECRKLFTEGCSSVSDHEKSGGSENEEDCISNERNKVYTKRRKQTGKKRTLAAVLPQNELIPLPDEEEVLEPSSSGQLRNFERAVNGDDVYKESSDERSLGEEEDMDLFVVKPKQRLTKVVDKSRTISHVPAPYEEEDSFDVSDLIHAAPPLACSDEFDDLDL